MVDPGHIAGKQAEFASVVLVMLVVKLGLLIHFSSFMERPVSICWACTIFACIFVAMLSPGIVSTS